MRRQVMWGSLIIILVGFISACAAFEDPSKKATENAQNTALWTRVYALETQESTIVALRQTADGSVIMQTQWADATVQVGALRATNSALLRNPSPPTVATPNLPPTAIGGGAPAGPQPTEIPSLATRYSQATTSTDQDEDGCAVNITTSFEAETTELIYFIVRVSGVVPGTTYGLRVSSFGQVVAVDPNFWTSDQAYADTCVWYGIDRDTMEFEAGTYSAELLANGVVAARTTFVITGEEEMMDES